MLGPVFTTPLERRTSMSEAGIGLHVSAVLPYSKTLGDKASYLIRATAPQTPLFSFKRGLKNDLDSRVHPEAQFRLSVKRLEPANLSLHPGSDPQEIARPGKLARVEKGPFPVNGSSDTCLDPRPLTRAKGGQAHVLGKRRE